METGGSMPHSQGLSNNPYPVLSTQCNNLEKQDDLFV